VLLGGATQVQQRVHQLTPAKKLTFFVHVPMQTLAKNKFTTDPYYRTMFI
jgi:hypothetical protein